MEEDLNSLNYDKNDISNLNLDSPIQREIELNYPSTETLTIDIEIFEEIITE
ncbi:hypothetical protein [Methanobrevibacter arboriphilus]|nr:hypothetical protein [Methanobrevibacter arboriphilus]